MKARLWILALACLAVWLAATVALHLAGAPEWAWSLTIPALYAAYFGLARLRVFRTAPPR